MPPLSSQQQIPSPETPSVAQLEFSPQTPFENASNSSTWSRLVIVVLYVLFAIPFVYKMFHISQAEQQIDTTLALIILAAPLVLPLMILVVVKVVRPSLKVVTIAILFCLYVAGPGVYAIYFTFTVQEKTEEAMNFLTLNADASTWDKEETILFLEKKKAKYTFDSNTPIFVERNHLDYYDDDMTDMSLLRIVQTHFGGWVFILCGVESIELDSPKTDNGYRAFFVNGRPFLKTTSLRQGIAASSTISWIREYVTVASTTVPRCLTEDSGATYNPCYNPPIPADTFETITIENIPLPKCSPATPGVCYTPGYQEGDAFGYRTPEGYIERVKVADMPVSRCTETSKGLCYIPGYRGTNPDDVVYTSPSGYSLTRGYSYGAPGIFESHFESHIEREMCPNIE